MPDQSPSTIEYTAPARLCLTYEVLGQRAGSIDRFNVVGVMQQLALADRLSFRLRDDGAINLTVEGGEIDVPPASNIIVRAARLLQQVSGTSMGADIHLIKRIPLGWGLAGAASDAATTIRALRQLWSLNLDYSNLLNLADILSPHAPYFVIGGTALVESNEQITPLPPLPDSWALLISPKLRVGDKTADLFSLLRWHMMGNGLVSRQLATTLKQGQRPSASLLQSTIEWVAGIRFAEIEDCRRDAVAAGVTEVRYCGPGPGFYALYETEAEALAAQEQMQTTDWPTLVSATTA